MKKFLSCLVICTMICTPLFASADTETSTAPVALDLSSTVITDSGDLLTQSEVDTYVAGWVAASSADQSCETTCGIATPVAAMEATSGLFVAIDDATADSCVCNGAIA